MDGYAARKLHAGIKTIGSFNTVSGSTIYKKLCYRRRTARRESQSKILLTAAQL